MNHLGLGLFTGTDGSLCTKTMLRMKMKMNEDERDDNDTKLFRQQEKRLLQFILGKK